MSCGPRAPAKVLAKMGLAASLALLVWLESTGDPAKASAGARSPQAASTGAGYRGPRLPIDRRVADLL